MPSCRHKDAYPTIYFQQLGFMWCPDCGAIRGIEAVAPGRFTYADDRWLLPKGKENVLRQMKLMEKREERAKKAVQEVQ